MEEFKVPPPSKINYLNAEYGLKSWLLTRDHKRIALLYLGSISVFFFIGGVYALLKVPALTSHIFSGMSGLSSGSIVGYFLS